MAYGQISGIVNPAPFAQDLLLEAYENCGIYSLETKHIHSGRRSANLVLQHMSNFGVNLWKIDSQPTAIPMPTGVPNYVLTPDVVQMYDTYRRTYQLGAPGNITPNFVTTLNSTSVLVNMPSPGVAVGNYVGIPIQVSIGGIILYGYYQVTSTPSASSFTITAASQATSGTSGGVIPIFTTVATNNSVSVNLPAHGYLAGQSFMVPISTTVGGIQIFGSYTIATVTDANHFTIIATSTPNASQTITENSGQAQVAVQLQGVPAYTDILMTPFSRNDYAALSYKLQPGPPTSYWFERTTTPQVNPWPVPDNNGPYELRSYFMRQIQNVNPTGGQTIDIPNRFDMAFALQLAKFLSMKWAPSKYEMIKGEADAAMVIAMDADRELVSTFLMPDVQGYFRG